MNIISKDIIVTLLSLLYNKDKLHLIISNKEMYNTYKQYLDPTENDHAQLIWALKRERIDCVKSLLQDPRIDPTIRRYKALKIAYRYALCGSHELLHMLLQHPKIDPNIYLEEGEHKVNVLVESVCYGSATLIRCILEDDRLSSEVCNKALMNTCFSAEWRYDHEIVDMLLRDKRVDPTVDNNKLIRMVAENGGRHTYPLMERLLKDPRIDPSAGNNEVFINCCSSADATVAKLLLKDPRVDPAARNNKAVKMTAYNGNYPVLKVLLLDPRVDPSVSHNKVLRLLCGFHKTFSSAYTKALSILLHDPRVNPADNNNEAIMIVSNTGNYKAMEVLLNDPRVDPTVGDNEPIKNSFKAYKRFYGTFRDKYHKNTLRYLLEDKRVWETILLDRDFIREVNDLLNE